MNYALYQYAWVIFINRIQTIDCLITTFVDMRNILILNSLMIFEKLDYSFFDH
jgi:hypothetical protein